MLPTTKTLEGEASQTELNEIKLSGFSWDVQPAGAGVVEIWVFESVLVVGEAQPEIR
jgi:hypothetical protein